MTLRVAKREIRLNAFDMATPGHIQQGMWTHPRDNSAGYARLDHWIDLARRLERGFFDGLFLADVLGIYDVQGGGPEAALRGGVQVPLLDPLMLVPAMAAATTHLGFGVTANTAYEPPYLFARRMSTLDHLTHGRIGWNIVTGYLDSAARALGYDAQMKHDDRYDLADEYMDAVRQAEIKVEKAKRWLNAPLPTVDGSDLNLELTTDEPREYLQTMFDLIYLAFRTDSTRVATYQIGRENGIGRSDHLSRAVGFNLAHQLTHETKNPDGWKNLGIYCRFLNEEFGRFVSKLKATPEPASSGSMLDNTLLLYGSASSAFHLSRNYPIILAGGKNMGFQHGQYINQAGANFQGGPWLGDREPWQDKPTVQDLPLSNLFVTMLQRLGVETQSFGDSTGLVDNV